MRIAFGLSLLLNALLGMLVLAARPHGAPAVPGRLADGAPAPVFDAGPLDGPSYYRNLRARGVSREETKPLVAKHLSDAFASPPVTPLPYWLPRRQAALERRLRELDAEEPVRTALLGIYGDAASEDPAFADLFRPLDERLPFLSAAEQLALDRAELVAASAREQRMQACGGALAANHCVVGAEVTLRGALRELFDAPTSFEIELRESALADRLRNLDLGLDETEFRRAYAILAGLDGGALADEVRAARRQLRQLLGDRRFDRVWAERDPAFDVVQRVLSAQRQPLAKQLSAYAVMNRAQDALLDAAAEANPARASQIAGAAASEERAELTALLGERTAASLLAERSRLLRSLTRGP